MLQIPTDCVILVVNMTIRNGNIALPGASQLIRADVAVSGEVISAIGRNLPRDGGPDIDATGLEVYPGAIDPHVHFFDPGFPDKEDFAHATAAAASGGVTTIIDMPGTSDPQVINVENLHYKRSVVEPKALVDFMFFGGVSSQAFEQGFPAWMEELAPFVPAFKTYATSGSPIYGRLNHYQFYRVLEAARELQRPILLHAEDADFVFPAIEALQKTGDSPTLFTATRPELAETLAVLAVSEIAETLQAPLHIVHIGTARAGEIVAGRTTTTGETCPQYLQFDTEDFERIGAPLKITPPVKGPAEKAKLWKLLAEGGIDFVASDHAPGTAQEKNTGSIWTDYAGIPGCPTLFPYTYSEGLRTGRLSLQRFLEVTSGAAARRYRIDDRKGRIQIGMDADLVLVDPAANRVVRGMESLSKGKITPFEGMELTGRVNTTIVRGTVVYTGDAIVAPGGSGRFLAPASASGGAG